MKARWWHLRGKASVKGEQVAQGSSVRACNLPCVWPTALFGWHLVLRCPVRLVTEHTALFSNFSRDYAVTKSNVLMPPRKRRIAGICWSDAPSEYVQKPKPTCGENGPCLLWEARGGPGMWVGGSTASFHVEVVIWQAVGASPQPGWIWRPCGMSHR